MGGFEWDLNKNQKNWAKHGVAFEEAASAFEDDRALIIVDPTHSLVEERFVLLGMSLQPRLLVVVHCYRRSDQVIRVISARKATKQETRQYFRGRYR